VLEGGRVKRFGPTYEPRIVIHLHTREGATIPLVLSREFISDPARGTYNRETLVVAKMGFGEDLHGWRKDRKPIRWIEFVCQEALRPGAQQSL
jgi:hypothetical protein